MFQRAIRWVAPAILAGVLFATLGVRSDAMPMFARKYSMKCAQCHTMPPRLTPMGYNFLRSGYRFKGMEEPPANLSNAASLLTEVHAISTHPDGDSGFDSDGAEIQVATSVGKDLALRTGFEFPGDATPTFGEAWFQYNAPKDGPILTARAGQIPLLSGFELGGDRNLTITDPMMFGENGPLTGEGEGNFSIAGLERGMELGVTDKGLTGKLSWVNGVDITGAGDVPLHGKRAKDFALQGEYLIGEEGTHIGAFYYNGKTPMDGFDNKFWRGAVFASYVQPLKMSEGKPGNLKLELTGGMLWGKDTLSAEGTKAKSRGNLVELDLYQNSQTSFTARYDTAKPSDVLGEDQTTKATTLSAAHLVNENLRVAAEYRNQRDPNAHSVIASLWFFY